MPFKSDRQRALFYAAEGDPSIRKKHGMTKTAVSKMLAHKDRSSPGQKGWTRKKGARSTWDTNKY